MNMVYAYQIIQHVPHLRDVDTRNFSLAIQKRGDFYFIFFEPVNDRDPKWNRTMAFVTEFSDDISNLMDIYEFANSKGAVEIEFL
jgi:hypothetical protein